jgi:hypothetical protein
VSVRGGVFLLVDPTNRARRKRDVDRGGIMVVVELAAAAVYPLGPSASSGSSSSGNASSNCDFAGEILVVKKNGRYLLCDCMR